MASPLPDYAFDILNLRRHYFVFWLPGITRPNPPQLLLGTYGGDGTFQELIQQTFDPADDNRAGLWLLDSNALRPPLDEGVYHYWFLLGDAKVTDPFAFTVDYGVDGMADPKARVESVQPPGVIRFRDRQLWACDVDGSEPARFSPPPTTTAANNHLVIYELPTSWARGGTDAGGDVDVDVGTFADVQALFDSSAPGRNFASVSTVKTGAILKELGINGLELLPAADAKPRGAWGYATAHYFAPDYDLGTASELVGLVNTIQGQGTRLLTDVVMAFGHESYGTLTDSGVASVFHIDPSAEPNNPDSYQAHTTGGQLRDGYGGRPWRYIETVSGTAYDPESGQLSTDGVNPSWAFHKSHLTRWMSDFGVRGLRLDSLNNVGNWDFIKAYKDKAWSLYNAQFSGGDGDPSRFLVIGEELSLPVAMLQQRCVDALWNENWLQRARAVLLGEGYNSDNFEWTVRKLVDCRQDQLDGGSFTDGTQAINYLTSHDIEGYRKNRLYNFCIDNEITDTSEIARRVRLAFVLLLTSVGVPMIFAGEEFADQEDQSQNMANKQTDPVNYERKDDGGWREAVFAYVANLVHFRSTCPALGVNDTNVFHVDESRGGRIMAWQRGGGERTQPVVVVANFTDQDTPGPDYDVPNWPDQNVAGWREVTQNRNVPAEWVGREPLFAWEAKVYTYWTQ
ncbi:hypothetical protein SBRCBS47491_010182 [Sporothrix bragantina]|uniref:Glycosyl hydrolase family 13 catalytic domain-containing protein n=1 Tax=Sporothrix bragantina TaxID=671064 RepID=A0ABP0D0E2_9PEZI